MPTGPNPATATPALWSRRKILLIFLVPPLLLVVLLLVYDERLEPAPDLVPAHPGAGLRQGQNGLAMLHAAWDPLPEVDWQYLGDEGLMEKLNPTGRDLRQDLADALAAPEWVEELKTLQDFFGQETDLPNYCFRAIIASAMQKARAGDRQTAIFLIRDLRRLAARQFRGSWSWDGLHVAMWRSRQALDMTCGLVTEGGFSGQELAELASIWEAEDLERKDFANPTAGEARFLALIMGGAAGKEYRFGTWERHGAIYPAVTNEWAQRYLSLTIRPNGTMNEAHRILRAVRENALATSMHREGSLFEMLQKTRPPQAGWPTVLHPNAGGKKFLRSYVVFPSLYLDLSSRLHLFSVRAMRVWIALRRWQQTHGGKLPALLTELVPEYLASIPHDPWDDQPLRWDAVGKVIFGTGDDWIPDVPLAADLDRQWISVTRDGYVECKNVALRFELPPPSKPPVAFPTAPPPTKKTPAPKPVPVVK